MAKFKQGNLILNNNKKIILGDNEDVSIFHDSSGLKISGQQIGRYSFINLFAKDFDLDDIDSGVSNSKVFGILRTLDYNEDTKGSAYISCPMPDGFDPNKDIKSRIIYSLNGNDASKVVKLTTSIWCSDYATTPSTADYTYNDTINSTSGNIGKLSKLTLVNTIIPSANFSSDKYISIKHTREADDAGDTYTGTYQLISIQLYQ